jgi:hypothetical protein
VASSIGRVVVRQEAKFLDQLDLDRFADELEKRLDLRGYHPNPRQGDRVCARREGEALLLPVLVAFVAVVRLVCFEGGTGTGFAFQLVPWLSHKPGTLRRLT